MTTSDRRQSLTATPIGRLRAAGLVEGASFLILLGIAMPLKYLAGMPIAVKIVGWIHGVLFILFLIALAQARRAAGWSAAETGIVLIAALLPFGPFVIDRRLRREETRTRAGPSRMGPATSGSAGDRPPAPSPAGRP